VIGWIAASAPVWFEANGVMRTLDACDTAEPNKVNLWACPGIKGELKLANSITDALEQESKSAIQHFILLPAALSLRYLCRTLSEDFPRGQAHFRVCKFLVFLRRETTRRKNSFGVF
jgi:hypothetical protein